MLIQYFIFISTPYYLSLTSN